MRSQGSYFAGQDLRLLLDGCKRQLDLPIHTRSTPPVSISTGRAQGSGCYLPCSDSREHHHPKSKNGLPQNGKNANRRVKKAIDRMQCSACSSTRESWREVDRASCHA